MTALHLIKSAVTNTIPYDECVILGKKIISEIEDKQWRLGDLANALEPKYGDRTLEKFADDLGQNFITMRAYRATARAWPELGRRVTFSVARELNAIPNRQEIVRNNPGLTQTEARKLVNGIKAKSKAAVGEEEEIIYPYQEPCRDCNSDEEQWQRSVANLLGDILSMRALWNRLFGDDWKTYRIPSSHIKLAMDAKKEIIQIMAILKEQPRDQEN